MFRAFVAARLAHLGACLAYGAGQLASSCHVADRKTADLCAIHVQGNTACHGFRIGLLQAGDGAIVTRDGTAVASVDTRLELFIGHDFLQLGICKKADAMEPGAGEPEDADRRQLPRWSGASIGIR
jgi:hypothetical protein